MRFVEQDAEHLARYRDFLIKLGSSGDEASHLAFGYYLPSPGIAIRRHLVLDDSLDPPIVVGAVNVKLQSYALSGGTVELAVVTYPISVGIVDARYGAVGLYLFRKLLQTYPLNILLGMGPPNTNVTAKLTQMLGWTLKPMPYLFLPKRLGRVARKNILHRPALAGLIGLADRLGLFWPLDRLQQARLRRRSHSQMLVVEPVVAFEGGVDEFWNRYRHEVGFSLVRDSVQLNAMFPETVGAFRKLEIRDGKAVIGYAVLLIPEPDDVRRVMGLNVVTLVEFSALEADVDQAAGVLVGYLLRLDIDAVITNHSHGPSIAALQGAGFLVRKTHVYLATSKPLQAMLDAAETEVERMVITRGDGDGPIGLGVDLS